MSNKDFWKMFAENWNEELKKEAEFMKLAKAVVDEAEENAKANPSSPEIQIVVVEPMKKPYKKTIENKGSAFNEIVDGWFEVVPIGTTKTGARLALHLNEEGKLIGLPFNRRIINFDILVGTFFITAFNLEGDNVTLSDEEADYYIKKFTPMEVYL